MAATTQKTDLEGAVSIHRLSAYALDSALIKVRLLVPPRKRAPRWQEWMRGNAGGAGTHPRSFPLALTMGGANQPSRIVPGLARFRFGARSGHAQQAGDRYVLVHVRPVDALAASDQTPVLSLLGSGVA